MQAGTATTGRCDQPRARSSPPRFIRSVLDPLPACRRPAGTGFTCGRGPGPRPRPVPGPCGRHRGGRAGRPRWGGRERSTRSGRPTRPRPGRALPGRSSGSAVPRWPRASGQARRTAHRPATERPERGRPERGRPERGCPERGSAPEPGPQQGRPRPAVSPRRPAVCPGRSCPWMPRVATCRGGRPGCRGLEGRGSGGRRARGDPGSGGGGPGRVADATGARGVADLAGAPIGHPNPGLGRSGHLGGPGPRHPAAVRGDRAEPGGQAHEGEHREGRGGGPAGPGVGGGGSRPAEHAGCPLGGCVRRAGALRLPSSRHGMKPGQRAGSR